MQSHLVTFGGFAWLPLFRQIDRFALFAERFVVEDHNVGMATITRRHLLVCGLGGCERVGEANHYLSPIARWIRIGSVIVQTHFIDARVVVRLINIAAGYYPSNFLR